VRNRGVLSSVSKSWIQKKGVKPGNKHDSNGRKRFREKEIGGNGSQEGNAFFFKYKSSTLKEGEKKNREEYK